MRGGCQIGGRGTRRGQRCMRTDVDRRDDFLRDPAHGRRNPARHIGHFDLFDVWRHIVERHHAARQLQRPRRCQRGRSRASRLIEAFDELRLGHTGHLPPERTPRARHLAHRRRHSANRQEARVDMAAHREPDAGDRDANAAVHGRGDLKVRAVGRHRVEMPAQHRRRHAARQLRLAQQLVGLANLPELVPGRRRHRLLIALHHLCARSGRRAHAWIEVEIAQPHRRVVILRQVRARLRAAIDRRRDGRIARCGGRERIAQLRFVRRLRARRPGRRVRR